MNSASGQLPTERSGARATAARWNRSESASRANRVGKRSQPGGPQNRHSRDCGVLLGKEAPTGPIIAPSKRLLSSRAL